jgi:peptide chain release factor subunit 1
MIDSINNDKLKELASIYDVKDTFISLYLDLPGGVNERFVSHRVNQIKSALKNDKKLLGTFETNMQAIVKYLKKDLKKDSAGKKIKGLVIFASKPMDYFRAYGVTHKVKDSMVVDTSPYIRPLAQLMDEWESYALVLINNNKAEMYDISMGAVEDKKQLAAHIMNKHKKGGWSQMRFSRLRKEAIDQFHKKVIESLDEFIKSEDIVGLIIAGPGEAKKQFKKKLPSHLNELVMNVLDHDMDEPTEKIVESATQEVAKHERESSDEAVQRLKSEILKGGLAVYGIPETVTATREGKAELLILSKNLKPRGWICEHCQVVDTGVKDKCPYCGNKTSDVDVLEEILEFAKRAGTKVEFVGNNPLLEELGGVGALLRY